MHAVFQQLRNIRAYIFTFCPALKHERKKAWIRTANRNKSPSGNTHGKPHKFPYLSPDAARIGQGDSEACPLQHIFFEGNSVHDHHLSPFITDHHPLPSMTVRDQPRPSMNIQQEAKTEGLWKNTIMKWQFARCNVGSWLVWGPPPPPPENIWTLFKVESQFFLPKRKANPHLSKVRISIGYNWNLIKTAFCRWTCGTCSTCSTGSSTCSTSSNYL